MKVRRPAQAGAFYSADKASLTTEIENCFLHKLGPGKLPKLHEGAKRKIVSAISPHAGYMYSGPVAAHLYSALASDGIPDLVIVLGPNHYGAGTGLSIMSEGAWLTPLGEVDIDTDAAKRICENSGMIDIDASAHVHEHSIEIQLPFLQYIFGKRFKFVPISMMMQDLESSRNVGEAIAKTIADRNALIIASSDMSHYEPQKQAERKDKLAIDAILKLDEKGLQRTVESESISMCGYGPVSSAIVASKMLQGLSARLLCYQTSGDITEDYSQVVGYMAAIISK